MRLGLGAGVGLAARDHDRGAGGDEPLGDRAPDPACPAGDDRHPPAEIEQPVELRPIHQARLGAARRAGDELLRRDQPVGVLDDAGQLVPVGIDVEADAQPAAVPDVRRDEEALRLLVDERRLEARR